MTSGAENITSVDTNAKRVSEGGGGEEWQYVLKVLTRKQKVFLFCFSSSGVLLEPKYICQGNIFKNKEKKATTTLKYWGSNMPLWVLLGAQGGISYNRGISIGSRVTEIWPPPLLNNHTTPTFMPAYICHREIPFKNGERRFCSATLFAPIEDIPYDYVPIYLRWRREYT